MITFRSKGRVWLAASLILVFLAVGMVGCGQEAEQEQAAPPQEVAEPVELLVSAAASLTDVVVELDKAYQAEHPNVTFTFNLASSGKLQQQIEQGAPADVFISAAQNKMDLLDEKELIVKETRRDLLKNGLVLVASQDNTTINGFDDLAKAKVIAMGEPDSVTAGKYAQESLTATNQWDQLQDKMVYAQNVRQVLAYVESGDAEAGLVYQTDAHISDKVKIVAQADESTHSSLVYPVAVVKASQNQEASGDFVDFLFSDKAQTILEQYGFTPIEQ